MRVLLMWHSCLRARSDAMLSPADRAQWAMGAWLELDAVEAAVAALVEAFGDVALGHFARQMAELDPERRAELERLAREG